MIRFYMAAVMVFSCLHSTVAAQEMPGLGQSSLLMRPLFDPSRRGKFLPPPHDDLPVVTGVVGDRGGWTAIFSGIPHVLGGLSVREGGVFEGWRVVSVSPQNVRLERMGVLRDIVPKSEYLNAHPQVRIGY